MKKRNWKVVFLFSLLISCLTGITSVNASTNNEEVKVASAAQDYSNLNFTKGDGRLPSGYTVVDGSGNTTSPSFDSAGRYNLSNGGSSSFEVTSSRPHGKRTTRFTLYEDVKMEIQLYTTGTGKNFIIHNGSSELFRKEVAKTTTYGPTYIQFQFSGVPASGKTFYIGASSSGIYVDYISFGVNDRARFDANGGTFAGGKTMVVVERPEGGSDIVTPPSSNPTNGDKIFVGWSESPTGSSATTTFEYNKTYYAIWKSASGVSVYLDALELEMDIGESELITASILPSMPGITFTWTSSNDKVATVQDGLVTGVGYGEAIITASFQAAHAECKVTVRKLIYWEVTFYDSYDKMIKDKENPFSVVEVCDKEAINNIPVIGAGKGYIVYWYNTNGTPENKNDDTVFDTKSKITSDLTLYAEIKIIPVATTIEVIVPKDSDAIKTAERSYYLPVNKTVKLTHELGREDEYFDAIKNMDEFKKYKNDVTWYSKDPNIATISKTTGVVTMKATGTVEIYAKLYENTAGYANHIILSPSIFLSCVGDVTYEGRKVNTTVNVIAEKGRFQVSGGTEKAVRFIGYISDDFFSIIESAKFRVEAIDDTGKLRKVFEYDVTSFAKEISYKSKNVYQSNKFKTWKQAGMVGAAFTITGLPDIEFMGKFNVTFMVGVQGILVPGISSIDYIGVA